MLAPAWHWTVFFLYLPHTTYALFPERARVPSFLAKNAKKNLTKYELRVNWFEWNWQKKTQLKIRFTIRQLGTNVAFK